MSKKNRRLFLLIAEPRLDLGNMMIMTGPWTGRRIEMTEGGKKATVR